MSRLQIEHRTVYTYRQPVGFGRHRLVLRPREGHDVRVESLILNIAPAHRLIWARDVFSNSVAIVDFLEQADRLEVTSIATVQRSLPFPREAPVEQWQIPLPILYDGMEASIVAAYQSPSYPEDVPDVQHWLRQFPELTMQTDAESLLMTICSLIHREVKYQRRMVKGVQTPAQTIKLGSGSCRDMATLMMDAVRTFGFSARFASGYLDCPASEAGRASMHAWVEVYLPIVGWHGFDPTLSEPASLKHIVVGVSQHPRGVMPVSGMYTGAGSDFIEMTAQIKIERLEAR